MNILQQKLAAAGRLYMSATQEGGDAGGAAAEQQGEQAEQGKQEEQTQQAEQADQGKQPEPAKQPEPTKQESASDEALKEAVRRAQEAEARAKELAEKVKRFDGIDLDAARAALEAQKKAEKERLEKEGNFERLKQMMAQEHQAELQGREAVIEQLKAEQQAMQAKLVELTIGNAFANSKFINNEMNLSPAKARSVYGDHFEVSESGEIVAYDKPKSAADRTPLVDSSGRNIGFDAAIAKLVDADPDRDTLIKSQMRPGSGSKPSVDRGAPRKVDNVHGQDRIKRGLGQLNFGKQSA